MNTSPSKNGRRRGWWNIIVALGILAVSAVPIAAVFVLDCAENPATQPGQPWPNLPNMP